MVGGRQIAVVFPFDIPTRQSHHFMYYWDCRGALSLSETFGVGFAPRSDGEGMLNFDLYILGPLQICRVWRLYDLPL